MTVEMVFTFTGSMLMEKLCTVLSTCPDKPVAHRIATQLVSEKLAACVNIVPGVESVYRWEGEVQTDSEHLLIIKTDRDLVSDAYELVSLLHPYDIPEWVVQDINAGSEPYLDWIKSSIR